MFTDCSEPVRYLSMNDGSHKTRIICTSAIQGDRDAGLFTRLVGNFMERFSDLNSCYYHHNRGNEPYCTHLRCEHRIVIMELEESLFVADCLFPPPC